MRLILSDEFKAWLKAQTAQVGARVQVRLDRAVQGNLGDVKPVGEGVSEMRLQFGPGYRLYFVQDGTEIIVLLCAGDKSTQKKDIQRAKGLALQWKE